MDILGCMETSSLYPTKNRAVKELVVIAAITTTGVFFVHKDLKTYNEKLKNPVISRLRDNGYNIVFWDMLGTGVPKKDEINNCINKGMSAKVQEVSINGYKITAVKCEVSDLIRKNIE